LSIVWLLFISVTVASAIVDLVAYRIPNAFVLALTALFLVVAAFHWTEVAWLSHLGALGLVFGAGIFLYAFGQMGAGDVKLLAVVTLWAGAFAVIPLLFWVSVCGLLAMAVILLLRKLLPLLSSFALRSKASSIPRVLRAGEGIPYGIAIAPGAIVASLSFPAWLWQ
jgi:prepilin peptidase CpaA